MNTAMKRRATIWLSGLIAIMLHAAMPDRLDLSPSGPQVAHAESPPAGSGGLAQAVRPASIEPKNTAGANSASGSSTAQGQPSQEYPASKSVHNPDNDHDYQRIDVSMSWHDAKALCESLGGYLATATSVEENDFIYQNFGKKHVCWLGANDEAEEGTWRWVTDEPFQYKNWFSREPNNKDGIEHYLILGNTDSVYERGQSYFYRFGSRWNDHPAHGRYHRVPFAFPVCEWNSPGVSTRLRPLPDDGDRQELLSFLQEMKAFRPDTSTESEVFLWRMPGTLKAAAQRILQLEKDESSDAYLVALRIMLEDRIGSVGYSAPQTHRQTLDLVKTLLRAKLEIGLDAEDVWLALWAARVFEHNADSGLAQEAYESYAELIAKSNNQEFSGTVKQMEEAAGRLGAAKE
jgi:hypothetical protein